jgi:hypothetical protein
MVRFEVLGQDSLDHANHFALNSIIVEKIEGTCADLAKEVSILMTCPRKRCPEKSRRIWEEMPWLQGFHNVG